MQPRPKGLSLRKVVRPRQVRPHHVRPRRQDLPDLVLAAGAACLVASALFVFAAPVLGNLRRAVTETAIRSNAATLQLAVESYAAANLGSYPTDIHAVLPWLPSDRPPANPVTGRPVEFRDLPGDLTYRRDPDGRRYVIEAWAPQSDPAPQVLLRLGGRRAADGS